MSDELLRALLTIAFGALAGGLTNTVAIWMLFHPYTPPTLFGRRIGFLQGAIPKNQARLAAAVGRTVGEKLLTDEDLARIFSEPGFRTAFDARLREFLEGLLLRERGSLRELIPSHALPGVESILDDVVEWGLGRLDEYLRSDDFPEHLHERAQALLASVADEPIAGVLTPAREAAISGAVEDWLAGMLDSDDFRATVDDYLERGAKRLLTDGRTLEEILPTGLVATVEKAIQSYLPLAIQRLGRLLEDEATRRRFETFVHDLLHGFLNDLKFHQRVVARLVMTENTVDKVLATIETEGAERLADMLQEPTVQDAMARGINDAIVDFLRRPITSVIGEAGDDSVVEARHTLTDWVVGLARDDGTRTFLLEKLQDGLGRVGAKTWGEVLSHVPAEQLESWLVAAARSGPARRIVREGAFELIDTLLDRPIGTPAHWLPAAAPERIEAALADPLWDWLQTQVPSVVRQINVADRVEQKVLHFPTPKMEELVRRVTDRELRLIVKLGYVLGAGIGAGLVLIDLLLR
ncbi:MAG: DUF445 family protein [Gemmatimonadetes bacterium]|nr:MAG: DUF445 family protein [Gemmatimonadota bacterium]